MQGVNTAILLLTNLWTIWNVYSCSTSGFSWPKSQTKGRMLAGRECTLYTRWRRGMRPANVSSQLDKATIKMNYPYTKRCIYIEAFQESCPYDDVLPSRSRVCWVATWYPKPADSSLWIISSVCLKEKDTNAVVIDSEATSKSCCLALHCLRTKK